MPGSVIVAGARTPIGKLSGALGSFSAAQLGAAAIRAALERSNTAPDEVDYVILGQVILAGTGQMPARQAAVAAGIPMTTPAVTVNKACLSGLNAIYQADLMISAGDAEIVVAGGMESMTSAPHLLLGARQGYRLGDATLTTPSCGTASRTPTPTSRWAPTASTISRSSRRSPGNGQDAFSAESHEQRRPGDQGRAAGAEIVPVEVPQRRGDPVVVSTDEGIRPGTTADSLGTLKAAFAKGGTVTAGNASQISDGGAAVIVMSEEAAKRHGVEPLGRVVSYGMVAGPDTCLMTQPSRSTRVALAKAGLEVGDIDLFEFNEAFAAVVLGSIDDLGISADVVNVNGGAVALGHPVGASGTRLALTILHELRRRGGGLGVAALCGGGGQGDALVVRAG